MVFPPRCSVMVTISVNPAALQIFFNSRLKYWLTVSGSGVLIEKFLVWRPLAGWLCFGFVLGDFDCIYTVDRCDILCSFCFQSENLCPV